MGIGKKHFLMDHQSANTETEKMSNHKRPRSSRGDDGDRSENKKRHRNHHHHHHRHRHVLSSRSVLNHSPSSSPSAGSIDNWHTLADALVEEVIRRLPLASRIRARTLNKTFRSFITKEIAEKKTPETPWFVSCVESLRGEVRAFFDPDYPKWRFIRSPLFRNGNRVVGAAPGGGVLVTDKQRNVLSVVNPLSTHAFDLVIPPSALYFCTFDVNSVSAADYTVLGFGFDGGGKFMLYRPSFGELGWREVMRSPFFMDRSPAHTVDAVFFDNSFCFLLALFKGKPRLRDHYWRLETRGCHLYILNIVTKQWNVKEGLETPSLLRKLKRSPALYLVHYKGGLMMVAREHISSHNKMNVWMFMLDASMSKWRQVRSIPGHILFLSRMGSKCVATAGKGNIIYFAERKGKSSVAMYDLSTHCVQHLPSASPRCSSQTSSYTLAACEGIWFHPQLN